MDLLAAASPILAQDERGGSGQRPFFEQVGEPHRSLSIIFKLEKSY